MDAIGYPKDLKRGEMSILFDNGDYLCFEALAANDQPYKSLKTLSETLIIIIIIMGVMKLDNHLGPLLI